MEQKEVFEPQAFKNQVVEFAQRMEQGDIAAAEELVALIDSVQTRLLALSEAMDPGLLATVWLVSYLTEDATENMAFVDSAEMNRDRQTKLDNFGTDIAKSIGRLVKELCCSDRKLSSLEETIVKAFELYRYAGKISGQNDL